MVYILIPVYNNKEEVLKLLGCLKRQTYRDIHIVIVDDGSTDGTEGDVRKLFPETTILKGNGKLWWTGANVMGVKTILTMAQNFDFVLLLNNDLTIEDNYVEKLVTASMSNNRAIMGSTLVDFYHHDFVEGGIRMDHQLNLFVNRDKENIEREAVDRNVDVLPGRGTLVPIEVFKSIGNFNKRRLPHYGADYEFSVRAKRAGYSLLLSHEARVFAKLGITGLETPSDRLISTKECFDLLFSKKSKTNILYYLNYVWLCSEKGFRLSNTLFSARGIIRNTLFKIQWIHLLGRKFSIFVSVFSVVPRILSKTFTFLFLSYPLRAADIIKYDLEPRVLVHTGIVVKQNYKGYLYYQFLRGVRIEEKMSGFSHEEKARINQLMNRSYSYFHKAGMAWEKIKILLSVHRTA